MANKQDVHSTEASRVNRIWPVVGYVLTVLVGIYCAVVMQTGISPESTPIYMGVGVALATSSVLHLRKSPTTGGRFALELLLVAGAVLAASSLVLILLE